MDNTYEFVRNICAFFAVNDCVKLVVTGCRESVLEKRKLLAYVDRPKTNG